MCACGCFLLVGTVAVLVYCAMHGLWLLALPVLLLGGAVGWLAKKTIQQ
jgi:hypothetical protein